jgi:hypothetical protein
VSPLNAGPSKNVPLPAILRCGRPGRSDNSAVRANNRHASSASKADSSSKGACARARPMIGDRVDGTHRRFYEYHDKRLRSHRSDCVSRSSSRAAAGRRAVWFNDGGFLLCSDIPNNRMLMVPSSVRVYRSRRISPAALATARAGLFPASGKACQPHRTRWVLTIIADRLGQAANSQ